mmetsp:Transcript_21222/g.63226  ORF Transcript_21222/g.63226 Transcript_21222/m.63226 type:complete len:1706 (+) Transcript_21222:545-5662(+)
MAAGVADGIGLWAAAAASSESVLLEEQLKRDSRSPTPAMAEALDAVSAVADAAAAAAPPPEGVGAAAAAAAVRDTASERARRTPSGRWVNPPPIDAVEAIARRTHTPTIRPASAPQSNRGAATPKLGALIDVIRDPLHALANWPTAREYATGGGAFLSDYVDELPDWRAIMCEVLRRPITQPDFLMRHGLLALEIHKFFHSLDATSQQIQRRASLAVSRRFSKGSIRATTRIVSSPALRDPEALVRATSTDVNERTFAVAWACVCIAEVAVPSRHCGDGATEVRVAKSATSEDSTASDDADFVHRADECGATTCDDGSNSPPHVAAAAAADENGVEARVSTTSTPTLCDIAPAANTMSVAPIEGSIKVVDMKTCLSRAASVVAELVGHPDELLRTDQSEALIKLQQDSARALCDNPQDCYGHLLYVLTLAHPENPAELDCVTLATAALDPSVRMTVAGMAVLDEVASQCGVTAAARQLEEFGLVRHGFTHSSRCYAWAHRLVDAIRVRAGGPQPPVPNAEFALAERTNRVLAERILEAARCFDEIFIVDSSGFSDAFSSPPATDELLVLWQACHELQTVLIPRGTDIASEFGQEALVDNFRKGATAVYAKVRGDCSGRRNTFRGDTPVLEDVPQKHALCEPPNIVDELARVATKLCSRLKHLTRMLRRSSFHESLNLASVITSECMSNFATDAERVLRRYLDDAAGIVSGEAVVDARPNDPADDRLEYTFNDEDILRLIFAAASLCRTWSLSDDESTAIVVQLFPAVVSQVFDNVCSKQIEWLDWSFIKSRWGDTVELPMPAYDEAGSYGRRMSQGSTSSRRSSVSSMERVSGIDPPPATVSISVPSCLVDTMLAISKYTVFARDVIAQLRLEPLEGRGPASGVTGAAPSENEKAYMTRLVIVLCVVMKEFVVRVLTACARDTDSELPEFYQKFCDNINLLTASIDGGCKPAEVVSISDDGGTHTTASCPGQNVDAVMSSAAQWPPQAPVSPQTTGEVPCGAPHDYSSDDDEVFDVDSFSIASPLRFSKAKSSQPSLTVRCCAQLDLSFPWNSLDVGRARVARPSQPAIVEDEMFITERLQAELEARIKWLWKTKGSGRQELCARLNTLAACSDLLPTLPSFVAGDDLEAISTSRLHAGMHYVASALAVGHWAYVNKLMQCIRDTLKRLLSDDPAGIKLSPDKEESFVRALLRRTGRFLQDEMLQMSRLLVPSVHDTLVAALMSEVYGAFASVCMHRGRFVPVHCATAYRARRCTLYFLGMFQRMPSVTVPVNASAQFAQLVELFEMHTTPTLDLGYLLLHCSHCITRTRGKVGSRTVTSADDAFKCMARLHFSPRAKLAAKSEGAGRDAGESGEMNIDQASDFDGSLIAMWASGIVPRLTESFTGVVFVLYRCLQVFRLMESGELSKKNHSRQFELKLHCCVYLATEMLRQYFHRHRIARARGFLWSQPRAFTGAEFCEAVVEAGANPPPSVEREARYGGGRLQKVRVLKHSADELLGLVVHRHNVVEVAEGSAAYRAGVAVGDNLVAVNGEDLRGLDHDEIVAVLQEKGTLRHQVFDVQMGMVADGVSGNDPLNPTEEFTRAGIEITLIVERKAATNLRDRPLWPVTHADAVEIGQMLVGTGMMEATVPGDGRAFTADKDLYRMSMDRRPLAETVQISKWCPPSQITDPTLAQGLIAAVLETRAEDCCTADILADMLHRHSHH